MSSGPAVRVAVVGAGFCGAALAYHLTRTPGGPQVTLLDGRGWFGPGLAYRTGDPRHLLNAPAGRMSALADDPEHFVRWARQLDPQLHGGSFLPRGVYGEYLRALVAAGGERITCLAGQVVDVRPPATAGRLTCLSEHVTDVDPWQVPGRHPPPPDACLSGHPHESRAAPPDERAPDRFQAGAPTTCLSGQRHDIRPAELVLADGRTLLADHVVLAVGNFPPRLPAGLDPSLRGDPRYVHDPWAAPGPAPARDASVLVLGTGLSALDLVLGLDGAGHRGPLHLLSRHGLLPQAHRAPARPPDPRPPAIERWPATARGTLHALRAAARAEVIRGGDWRDVLADLRPVTQAIWRRWPAAERERFVRHLRVYWEAHRHRAAPATAAAIADLRASGRLQIHAGRIEDMSLGTDSIAVTVRPRGGRMRERLVVDTIINATGPATDPRLSGDPLLLGLVRRGLLVPDPLGAAVDDDGALLDADGRASTWLHALGGLRRPQLWETTAVLELGPQCQALAHRLLSRP